MTIVYVCNGCRTLIGKRGRCGPCAKAKERARGTSAQRGYGAEHQRLRRAWQPHVASGLVDCARCHEPIEPGAAWDLGHDDHDRTRYHGPEHASCNRGGGHRAGAAARRLPATAQTSGAEEILWVL